MCTSISIIDLYTDFDGTMYQVWQDGECVFESFSEDTADQEWARRFREASGS